MQLEVYQTDAEAYEAAAALAAERLARVTASGGHASLALPGGRGGRVLMLALAGHGEIVWPRVDVYFTDDCGLPDGDARRTLAVARESLLSPRGVPADRVHPMLTDGSDAAAAATAYGAHLLAAFGSPPILDVVLVDLAPDGGVAAVTPGSAAAGSAEPVAVVAATEVTPEPRVPRITLTPIALRSARQVIVTATGASRAAAVASALRDPVDVVRRPAQAILPSDTVSWFVDRAAADTLLRDACPAVERPARDAQ
jgi:6-phosphogluconolactonase